MILNALLISSLSNTLLQMDSRDANARNHMESVTDYLACEHSTA